MKDRFYKRTFEGHLRDFLEKANMEGDLENLEACIMLIKYAAINCKKIYCKHDEWDELSWKDWLLYILDNIMEELK